MDSIDPKHICYNNPLMLERIRLPKGVQNPNFPLTTGTRNALESEGIQYVGQLVTWSEDDLAKVRRIGLEAMTEIKKLLKEYGLTLGVPCTQILRTEDDLRRFYSINPPQSKPVLKQSWPYIEIKLSLPIDEINGFTDEEVIAVVQPDCQKHFERAVKVKALEELSAGNQELYQMYIDQISMQMSDWCSGDKLREIAVPVAPPECLSVTFKEAVLNEVAKDLGGLVLYSSLGPSLDSLNVR